MDMRTWRGRLWLGLSIFVSVAFVMLIGPTYLRPLPMWAKLVFIVAGSGFIAAVGIYGRRRARRAASSL
jgi:hypothetical protein